MLNNPAPQTRPDDPDQNATGFVGAPDPLRYNAPKASFDPEEKNGIVRTFIGPGRRVLDVGCGTGSTLKELRDTLSCDVVGVEPNPRRVDAARQCGIPVLWGTLDQFDPEQIGRFDAVLFLDILEHLSDPAALLKQARQWLNPGGIIVASVPNVAHWTVRWELMRGRFDYVDAGIMDATHLRWFTDKSFRQLFETNGFEVREYKASSGSWMPVYARSAPWRWLSPRRRTPIIHRLKRVWPQLFGCQHIVYATPRD